jgi:type IV secretory pathway protease TraF
MSPFWSRGGLLLDAMLAMCLGFYLDQHLLINLSPSLPEGIYWRLGWVRPLQVGDLVILTPPDAALPYLEGWPQGLPLLKEVAGSAGHLVCWDVEYMRVERRGGVGQTYARLVEQPLPSGGTSCELIGPREVVVVGQHARSIDSRTFGLVDTRRLVSTVVPLWRWGQTP